MKKNWFTHEPDGRKPAWSVVISFSLPRKEQISLKINFSKLFPNTDGRSNTGR